MLGVVAVQSNEESCEALQNPLYYEMWMAVSARFITNAIWLCAPREFLSKRGLKSGIGRIWREQRCLANDMERPTNSRSYGLPSWPSHIRRVKDKSFNSNSPSSFLHSQCLDRKLSRGRSWVSWIDKHKYLGLDRRRSNVSQPHGNTLGPRKTDR